MPSSPAIPLADQAACVRREIGYRERVYRRLVSAGSMKPATAEQELETMRAVLATLEVLIAEQEPRLI